MIVGRALSNRSGLMLKVTDGEIDGLVGHRTVIEVDWFRMINWQGLASITYFQTALTWSRSKAKSKHSKMKLHPVSFSLLFCATFTILRPMLPGSSASVGFLARSTDSCWSAAKIFQYFPGYVHILWDDLKMLSDFPGFSPSQDLMLHLKALFNWSATQSMPRMAQGWLKDGSKDLEKWIFLSLSLSFLFNDNCCFTFWLNGKWRAVWSLRPSTNHT